MRLWSLLQRLLPKRKKAFDSYTPLQRMVISKYSSGTSVGTIIKVYKIGELMKLQGRELGL